MPRKAKNRAEVIEEPLVAELTPEEQTAADEANTTATAPDVQTLPDERLIAVWERRFVNPGPQSSTAIQLTIKGMTTRWINTAIEGRHHKAVHEQGWQPVPLKLLKDPESIPDLYKHPHGIVCRGERGKEVLMMMPEEVFKRIQRRKAELNTKSIRNLRAEMAQAAASKFGAEAGDFVATGQSRDGLIKTVGSINFGTERVPMGD